jgi:hypothetical protein
MWALSAAPTAEWCKSHGYALVLPIFDGGSVGVRRRQLHNMLQQSSYDPLAAAG